MSVNPWLYTYANPVNCTDPSGENPIAACISLFAALALIDGPLPVADIGALAACAVILGSATTAAITAAYYAPEMASSLDSMINRCVIPDVVVEPRVGDRDSTWQNENPFGSPTIWQAPKPNPTPRPLPAPKPAPVPVNPLPPTSTPRPKHIFYFSEIGEYPIPGRETSEILRELEFISYIPGVSGFIGQLESATKSSLIMGRKFESERALYYFSQGKLQEVNSTSLLYDLMVTNLGTINYIEVKWSGGAISKMTLNKVINQARMHHSGTFMLETTWISMVDTKYLLDEGGIEYP